MVETLICSRGFETQTIRLTLTHVGLGRVQVRDLIDPLFESKVPNAAGVEDQSGDALPRITREAHRADVPGKNVAHSWPKSLCFLLQPRQTQVPVLQHDAVNRVDFFADVSAHILTQFRAARRKRRRRFKYVRLFAPEALLQSARVF